MLLDPLRMSTRVTASARGRTSAFLLLCSAVLGGAVAVRAQSDDVRIRAQAGLGGQILSGAWIPVVVEADGGPDEVVGEVRIVLDHGAGARDLATESTSVAPQARKRFEFELLGRVAPSISVELRDTRGRSRGRTTAPILLSGVERKWFIVGDAWMGLEAMSGPDGNLQVHRLEVDLLPRRPLGWSAAERVLVAPPAPARPWEREARDALVRWIQTGGSAVIDWKTLAEGFLPDLEVPPVPEWRSARVAPEAWAGFLPGVVPPAAEMWAFHGRVDGMVPISPPAPDGSAWAFWFPLGLGDVTVLGFSFDAPPLREWPGRLPLWSRLCDTALEPAPAAGASSESAPAPQEAPGPSRSPETSRRSLDSLGTIVQQQALPEAADRLPLVLLAVVSPLGFAWFLLAHVLARARTGRDLRRALAAFAAAGAGLGIALAWGAYRPSPFAHAFHSVRAIPGTGGEAHGVSLYTAVSGHAGTIDLLLSDPEGGLGLIAPGDAVWRHPYRRFAREDAGLLRVPEGCRIAALKVDAGDYVAAAAEWRGRPTLLEAVTVRVEGRILRIRNGAPVPLFGVRWWDGRQLHAPAPIAPGAESVLDPDRVVERMPVRPAVRPPPGASFRDWLRKEIVSAGLEDGSPTEIRPALGGVVTSHLEDRPRRLPPGRSTLFFHVHADPEILLVEGSAPPAESWTIVEWPLPP